MYMQHYSYGSASFAPTSNTVNRWEDNQDDECFFLSNDLNEDCADFMARALAEDWNEREGAGIVAPGYLREDAEVSQDHGLLAYAGTDQEYFSYNGDDAELEANDNHDAQEDCDTQDDVRSEHDDEDASQERDDSIPQRAETPDVAVDGMVERVDDIETGLQVEKPASPTKQRQAEADAVEPPQNRRSKRLAECLASESLEATTETRKAKRTRVAAKEPKTTVVRKPLALSQPIASNKNKKPSEPLYHCKYAGCAKKKEPVLLNHTDAIAHVQGVHRVSENHTGSGNVPCLWEGCKEAKKGVRKSIHYDHVIQHLGVTWKCPMPRCGKSISRTRDKSRHAKTKAHSSDREELLEIWTALLNEEKLLIKEKIEEL